MCTKPHFYWHFSPFWAGIQNLNLRHRKTLVPSFSPKLPWDPFGFLKISTCQVDYFGKPKFHSFSARQNNTESSKHHHYSNTASLFLTGFPPFTFDYYWRLFFPTFYYCTFDFEWTLTLLPRGFVRGDKVYAGETLAENLGMATRRNRSFVLCDIWMN